MRVPVEGDSHTTSSKEQNYPKLLNSDARSSKVEGIYIGHWGRDGPTGHIWVTSRWRFRKLKIAN